MAELEAMGAEYSRLVNEAVYKFIADASSQDFQVLANGDLANEADF